MLVKEVEVEVYVRRVFRVGKRSLGFYLPTRVGEYFTERGVSSLYTYLDIDTMTIVYTPELPPLDDVKKVRIVKVQTHSVNIHSKKTKVRYRVLVPKDYYIDLGIHSGDLVQLKFYPTYGVMKVRKIGE